MRQARGEEASGRVCRFSDKAKEKTLGRQGPKVVRGEWTVDSGQGGADCVGRTMKPD